MEISEVDFRGFFKHMQGTYMLLGPDLHIITCTDLFYKMSLKEAADADGKYLFDVFPDSADNATASGKSKLHDSLLRVLRTKKEHIMDLLRYDIESAPGQFQAKYWSCTNRPVLGADGEILYMIHRAEDVSELVELNEKKTAYDEVKKRNLEIEVDIYRKNQELIRLNQELETFSYTVSHDLRAPLRAMLGFAQILAEDYSKSLPSEALTYLDRVIGAARRMSQLIDGLLGLSRLSRTHLEKTWVDLSQLAREIAFELQNSQPDRKVNFKILDGLKVECDKQLLYAGLQNLIGNAWKFTSKKTSAEIEVGATEKDGKKVFFVQDNGAGFDMRYADKLFGAFQRLHTTNDFEGTGIGLATVQRIIDRHGGEIKVQSEIDRGTTFFFHLG